jgi:predicted membrane channel-forming protein YqfA (hemolysin III family)
MLKGLREPVNSLTHWAGAFLALIGLIALLILEPFTFCWFSQAQESSFS